MTMPDLKELREKAEAATEVRDEDLTRYEHGGGRLAIIRGDRRELIADFYGDGADREFYAAANPATILALLDRLSAEAERRESAERERDALKCASAPFGLKTLYEIREAMGFNRYTSLDILARDCQSARRVLSGKIIPDENATLLNLAEEAMRRLKETQAEALNYRQLYEGGYRSDPQEPGISVAEQKDQAARCGCHGADDYCPCQNVPDRETRAARAHQAKYEGKNDVR